MFETFEVRGEFRKKAFCAERERASPERALARKSRIFFNRKDAT